MGDRGAKVKPRSSLRSSLRSVLVADATVGKSIVVAIAGAADSSIAFATVYTVQLSPLPCWERPNPELRKERIADLVREVDAEAAAWGGKTGKPALGPAAIQQQQPHDQPMSTGKS